MEQRHHPLSLPGRMERISRWGSSTESSEALAERIHREFLRRVDTPTPTPWHAPQRLRNVPESRLPTRTLEAVSRIAEASTAAQVRVACSLGKSYPDLIAARSGEVDAVTDVVVRPTTKDELRRAIDQLVEDDVAIVPLGGGTSVVGGVEPLGAIADQPVATIDLGALNQCLDVDVAGRVARFQAGVRGPDLERVLAGYGLTLGHVPQSFEWATLGGWIATRSAGQQSLAFGKIERMTAAIELVVPGATVGVDHLPAHGAGPGGLDLIMGSEGTMGVIAEATMRLRRLPETLRFQTYVFGSFEQAASAGQTLVQGGLRPAVVRISDAEETAFSIGSSLPGGVVRTALSSVARGIGLRGASMMMVIIPGETADAGRRLDAAVDQHMHRCGGRAVGPYPARHWYHARFLQPYARDCLMDRGLLVDTLETSIPWNRVSDLHQGVRAALSTTLGLERSMVGCHISHLYEDGASLYFTFIAAVPAAEQLDLWRKAKRAVHRVLARHGAAVSHQHGVGTMHADLYREVHDERIVSAWRAARGALVGDAQFNPGKLLDPPVSGRTVLNSVEGWTGDPHAPSQLPSI